MKKTHSNRNLYTALVLVAIVVVITVLSASNIGFHMTKQTASSVQKSQIIFTQKEGQPYPLAGKGVVVQTITATNSIIPRRLPLGPAHGCLYNTQTGQGIDVNPMYGYPATTPIREFEVPPGEVIDIGMGQTKIVTLSIQPYVVWIPKDTSGVKPEPQDFDTLYLFVSEKEEDYFYPQCYNLPDEQKAMAIKIPLV
jgi:hypothetical protein